MPSAPADVPAGPSLLRNLRKWDVVALVINSVIGAGIFGLPAPAFALAGVYSLLAYVVCAVLVFLIVLCFAEVSSRFKDTGGLYLYARAAFGPFVGFEIGWLTWLARATAFAALCNLFADYLGFVFPAAAVGTGRTAAIVITVLGLAAANVVGVRQASQLGNALTVSKLLPLILLVAAGVFFIEPGRFSAPSIPGYAAFSSSVLLLFFAFTGFETALFPAGESQDPRRHIPFALVLGTTFAALLYIAIQAVCIGTLPDLASSQRPLADAGGLMFGAAGATFIAVGALVSTLGTMSVNMLGAPRLLFAMADHRQLPRSISNVHPRFRTPYVAILLYAAMVLVLTLAGTFASSATISTVTRLVTYAVTCAALPILRRKDIEQAAAFRVRGGVVVSIAALILTAWLLTGSTWSEAQQVLIAAAAGLVFHVAFSRRRR